MNRSLKNNRVENDLIRRVESLERDIVLMGAALSEKLGYTVCDQCEDGREKFFFPKLDEINQIWYSTGGLLTGGLAWCRDCLNNKWYELSSNFEAKEYEQSKREVAIWIAHKSQALIKGSSLSSMADVMEEVKQERARY